MVFEMAYFTSLKIHRLYFCEKAYAGTVPRLVVELWAADRNLAVRVLYSGAGNSRLHVRWSESAYLDGVWFSRTPRWKMCGISDKIHSLEVEEKVATSPSTDRILLKDTE